MAPENTPAEPAEDQQNNDQQQVPTPQGGGNGEQQQVPALVVDKSTKLPDDHPLVTAHQTVKTKLSEANTELAEARAQAARAAQLEQQQNERPTTEALQTLQTRYDRLEAFLQQAGGDLGRALDSRSFTKELFETDTPVDSIVKKWNREHPSATTQALGGGGTSTQGDKPDPNALIRAAWNKGAK